MSQKCSEEREGAPLKGLTFPLFEPRKQTNNGRRKPSQVGHAARVGQEEHFSDSPIISNLELCYLEDAVLFPCYFVSSFSFWWYFIFQLTSTNGINYEYMHGYCKVVGFYSHCFPLLNCGSIVLEWWLVGISLCTC